MHASNMLYMYRNKNVFRFRSQPQREQIIYRLLCLQLQLISGLFNCDFKKKRKKKKKKIA